MRAFYVSSLDHHDGEIVLEDEVFQHLKVVRLKIGEELLLLNGKGVSCMAALMSLEKKRAVLKADPIDRQKQTSQLDMAIGLVKKDAFDLCLKVAVELGVRALYPVTTNYSQRYEINHERAQRLMIQALEQSNGRWLPQLSEITDFASFVENTHDYQHHLIMGMDPSKSLADLPALSGPLLGVIGPEGGFDENEQEVLLKLESSHLVHLPSPIMRTPTAVAALAGVIFTKQRLLD